MGAAAVAGGVQSSATRAAHRWWVGTSRTGSYTVATTKATRPRSSAACDAFSSKAYGDGDGDGEEAPGGSTMGDVATVVGLWAPPGVVAVTLSHHAASRTTDDGHSIVRTSSANAATA